MKHSITKYLQELGLSKEEAELCQTSRDAIIPVIEKQSFLMRGQFIDFLCELVLPTHEEEYDGSDYIAQTSCVYLVCATPKQLCIALLKAAGKWKK